MKSKRTVINDDALFQVIQDEIDKLVITTVYTETKIKHTSDHTSQKALDLEYTKQKSTIINLFKTSVKTQRLYFVLRSIFMGLISALITFTVILYLGNINFMQSFFLGIFVFIFSLMFSRLFDNQIVSISMKIIDFLEKHNRLKTVILKAF